MRLPRLLLLPAFLAAACTDDGLPPDASPDMTVTPDLSQAPDLDWDRSLVADRPYESKVPAGYDAGKPTPLVLALHGLGDSGANFVRGMGLLDLADQEGFLVAYPDGTTSQFGRYWNANDVCCQLTSPAPDDVTYLAAVLSDMSERYNVDPRRVYFAGLSNGSMMANRLACELSTGVAAILSIAGSQWNDESRCQPARTVAVLHIHGDADTTVPYNGGPTLNGFGPPVDSAHETIAVWVDRNGCGATADTSAPPVDIDGRIMGEETTIERWSGCREGGAAELWTVHGGPHVSPLAASAPAMLYGWLKAHAR